ncbi:MAG: ketoacyl-ACP synthase III [Leptospirales bacterium]
MSTRERLNHIVHLSGIGWVKDLPRIPFPEETGFQGNPEELHRLTGIRTRTRAGSLETEDLAERACRDLFRSAPDLSDSVDFLLVSTTTPAFLMPSTAALIAYRLFGHRAVPALDVGGSCSGFLVALQTAAALIGSGGYRNVLIVSAEKKSTQLCPLHGPETAPLFGDMAAAALISKERHSLNGQPSLVIKSIRTATRGDLANLIRKETDPCDGRRILRMDGTRVFREAITILSREIPDFLSRQHLKVTDLGMAVFHQANARLLAKLSERLGIPPEKLPLTIVEHGNTSSASLPLTLGHGLGRIPFPEGPLLLATFGGGITYGMALLDPS